MDPGPLVSIILGTIFWVFCVVLGGYWTYDRTLGQSTFASSLHEAASGLLIIGLAIHCCLWEIRSAQPRYQTSLHRYQHGAHALAYAVVGCFFLELKPEWLGITVCVAGLVICIFRTAVLCSTKVGPSDVTLQQPLGGSMPGSSFPAANSSFASTRSGSRTAPKAPVLPRPDTQASRQSLQSSASPFGSANDLEVGVGMGVGGASQPSPFAAEAEEEDTRPASSVPSGRTSLMPEIRMWNPDEDD
mmetsp:Transcript_96751/g.211586  ORF Transcript_96751/g.211586 Transcript_96751/m.211586 type:complete len:245 (+) Transcript_96751:196-930(+)